MKIALTVSRPVPAAEGAPSMRAEEVMA